MPLKRPILERLAAVVARSVKPFIGAKALRESLTVRPDRDGHLVFRFAQYWARWYIEGRRAVSGNLIYFKDPRDDPRLANGFPATHRQEVRRLTRAELRDALEDDKVIMTDHVGPAPAHPFLDFVQPEDPDVEAILTEAMDDFVSESVLKGVRGQRPRG